MLPYSTLMATIQKVGLLSVLFSRSPHLEDVARAIDIAFQYRHYFRKDVIIDLLVYRRWHVVLIVRLSPAENIGS
jgi:hypothetical protein